MESLTIPARRSLDGVWQSADIMLYPVLFLGAFGVIETVQGAYQIAGDAADTLKAYAFAYQNVVFSHFICLVSHVKILLRPVR